LAAPFTSILCGIEGNPSSTEAARQAIALAAPGATLRFIAVYTSFELGPDYVKGKLEESLEEAGRLAEEAGVAASTEMREARYAVDVLLPESEKHDLLAIGTHGKSRAAEILLGGTANEIARGVHKPLLIAREPSDADGFPSGIVFASDGSSGSWAPARAAGAIAAEFNSRLTVLHVADEANEDASSVVDAQAAEIQQVTGQEPTLETSDGHPGSEIVDAANAAGASLIICGRKGLRGVKSLGSVSERVVHHAKCSVLLVPPGEQS
jgi:nucleotide-binding universal stress UspA family protein